MNIKHREELLQQIAAELNKLRDHRICDLAIILSDGVEVSAEGDECDDEYAFDLPTFLDYLANDIYWNEEANWANARRAIVIPL